MIIATIYYCLVKFVDFTFFILIIGPVRLRAAFAKPYPGNDRQLKSAV